MTETASSAAKTSWWSSRKGSKDPYASPKPSGFDKPRKPLSETPSGTKRPGVIAAVLRVGTKSLPTRGDDSIISPTIKAQSPSSTTRPALVARIRTVTSTSTSTSSASTTSNVPVTPIDAPRKPSFQQSLSPGVYDPFAANPNNGTSIDTAPFQSIAYGPKGPIVQRVELPTSTQATQPHRSNSTNLSRSQPLGSTSRPKTRPTEFDKPHRSLRFNSTALPSPRSSLPVPRNAHTTSWISTRSAPNPTRPPPPPSPDKGKGKMREDELPKVLMSRRLTKASLSSGKSKLDGMSGGNGPPIVTSSIGFRPRSATSPPVVRAIPPEFWATPIVDEVLPNPEATMSTLSFSSESSSSRATSPAIDIDSYPATSATSSRSSSPEAAITFARRTDSMFFDSTLADEHESESTHDYPPTPERQRAMSLSHQALARKMSRDVFDVDEQFPIPPPNGGLFRSKREGDSLFATPPPFPLQDKGVKDEDHCSVQRVAFLKKQRSFQPDRSPPPLLRHSNSYNPPGSSPSPNLPALRKPAPSGPLPEPISHAPSFVSSFVQQPPGASFLRDPIRRIVGNGLGKARQHFPSRDKDTLSLDDDARSQHDETFLPSLPTTPTHLETAWSPTRPGYDLMSRIALGAEYGQPILSPTQLDQVYADSSIGRPQRQRTMSTDSIAMTLNSSISTEVDHFHEPPRGRGLTVKTDRDESPCSPPLIAPPNVPGGSNSIVHVRPKSPPLAPISSAPRIANGMRSPGMRRPSTADTPNFSPGMGGLNVPRVTTSTYSLPPPPRSSRLPRPAIPAIRPSTSYVSLRQASQPLPFGRAESLGFGAGPPPRRFQTLHIPPRTMSGNLSVMESIAPPTTIVNSNIDQNPTASVIGGPPPTNFQRVRSIMRRPSFLDFETEIEVQVVPEAEARSSFLDMDGRRGSRETDADSGMFIGQ